MSNEQRPVATRPFEHECIEPDLGRELWRLDDPQCGQEMRTDLEIHLEFCAACRVTRSLAARTANGLADGRLHIHVGGRGGTATAWLGGGSLLALVASLALILLLPPVPVHKDMTLRGEEEPAILRPVADEVVVDATPIVRWSPVEGAARYRISVESIDAKYRWETTTEDTEIRISDQQPIPENNRFRITVDAIPEIFSPPEGMNSSFRRSGRGPWFKYRIGSSSNAVRLLGAAGLLGMLISATSLFLRRQ